MNPVSYFPGALPHQGPSLYAAAEMIASFEELYVLIFVVTILESDTDSKDRRFLRRLWPRLRFPSLAAMRFSCGSGPFENHKAETAAHRQRPL